MMKSVVSIFIAALLSSSSSSSSVGVNALDACSDCIRTGGSRILQNSLNGLQQMCSRNDTCPTTVAHCDFIRKHPGFVTGYFVGNSLPLAEAASFCSLSGKCAAVNRTEIIANLLHQTDIDHQAFDLIHASALLDLWPATKSCNKPMLFDYNDGSNGNDDNTDFSDDISSNSDLASSIAADLGNMGAANEPFRPREIRCIRCTKRNIANTLAASIKYLSKVCASHAHDGDFWTSRCSYVKNPANAQVIEGYLTGHFAPTTFAVGLCLGEGVCESVKDLANWHPVQPFAVRLGFNGYF